MTDLSFSPLTQDANMVEATQRGEEEEEEKLFMQMEAILDSISETV